MGLLNSTYYDNKLETWLFALLIFITILIALYTLKQIIVQRLTAIAKRTETDLDDLVIDQVKKTKLFFLFFVSLYLASLLLNLPGAAMRTIHVAMVIALLTQTAIWGNGFIHLFVSRYNKQKKDPDSGRLVTVAALGFASRLVLWSFLLLLALDNIGINVTTLITGLGIGGIAVALAVQNILGDLFASLSIMLDKPFVLGDFITVDEYMGKVEYIGLKTTRLRSLFGEQIIFSNNDLLKSRIRNYKRMLERRVVFTICVTYENPYENLKAVPDLIRRIIQKQPHARFDRAHFKEYRDFALNFEVVYFVDSPDYNLYMDTQHTINLALFRCFNERGIEFAHQASAHTQQLTAIRAAKEATHE